MPFHSFCYLFLLDCTVGRKGCRTIWQDSPLQGLSVSSSGKTRSADAEALLYYLLLLLQPPIIFEMTYSYTHRIHTMPMRRFRALWPKVATLHAIMEQGENRFMDPSFPMKISSYNMGPWCSPWPTRGYVYAFQRKMFVVLSRLEIAQKISEELIHSSL